MKKSFSIIMVLMHSALIAMEQSEQAFTLMTYNQPTTFIDSKYLCAPIQKHPRRFDYAKQVVEQVNPDIIAWQEIKELDVEKLLTHLTQYAVVNDTQDVNYIFYKKDLFDVFQQGIFWLHPANRPEPAWGSSKARACTWVKLRDKITGKTFFVFNVQFDKNMAACRNSVQLIGTTIEQMVKQDLAFLVGDFKQGLTGAIKAFVDEFHLMDTTELALYPNGPNDTNFKQLKEQAQVGDLIFTNNMIDIQEHQVVAFERKKQASNHRPVMIKFALPSGSTE